MKWGPNSLRVILVSPIFKEFIWACFANCQRIATKNSFVIVMPKTNLYRDGIWRFEWQWDQIISLRLSEAILQS